MNCRDFRLYHYEYRKPRTYNPTLYPFLYKATQTTSSTPWTCSPAPTFQPKWPAPTASIPFPGETNTSLWTNQTSLTLVTINPCKITRVLHLPNSCIKWFGIQKTRVHPDLERSRVFEKIGRKTGPKRKLQQWKQILPKSITSEPAPIQVKLPAGRLPGKRNLRALRQKMILIRIFTKNKITKKKN